ncbi:putative polyadenylation and cleavage factor [Cocos nucifera]|uniref:Putative polyadenylation and cleavage factor n=1 Tax=Cocos nucifera TaxID=13894 RepID=A0A8K0IW91_COCNU|nr:putative polyadenylation and cleavage factor [Cocos nucifera]
MEKESSRQPAIREPATKRPRVPEGGDRNGGSNGATANRDRSVPPFRAPTGSGQALAPKPGVGTKAASKKQESNQQQEEEEEGVEELVTQYQSALADLTSNSRPIITNLSIIAGENLHAAKEIAEIICDNILAVCSEHKLLSLYLLDSITKNVGGDYVDYFAAKLPEVFCKAYKQVDSSILPSMRHLFQTWEKHFPPAPLQTIEKELGFPPTAKGPSGSTTVKSDSQRRAPQQGTYINPKYLEGRQHIQQSTRVKEAGSGDTRCLMTPVCDVMRPDRAAATGRSRPLMDLPVKKANNQHPLRGQLSVPVHEKKGYGGCEIYSHLAKQSELEVGTLSERDKEQGGLGKPWYGANGTAAETPIGKSSGFSSNNASGDYRALGSGQVDHHLPSVRMNNATKISQLTYNGWKNSDEEEYMWDDEFDQHFAQQCNQQDTASKLSIEILDSKSTEQTAWVQHALMAWPSCKSSHSMVSLGHMSSRYSGLLEGKPTSFSGSPSTVTSSSLSRPGLLPHVGLPGRAVPTKSLGPLTNIHSGFGQLRQQSDQPPSPSAHLFPSAPLQHQKLHIPTNHGQMRPLSFPQTCQKPMHLPGQLNQSHRALTPDYSVLPQNNAQQAIIFQNLSLYSSQPPQQMQNSSASSPFTQLMHCYPLLQQSHPDPSLQQPLPQPQFTIQMQKQPPSTLRFETNQVGFSGTSHLNSAINLSGQSGIGNLLDGIMKSGVLSNNSTSIKHCSIPPPFPSGPLPIQMLTSSTVMSSSLTVPTSCSKTTALKTTPPSALLPPLPPGPPFSSLGGTLLQMSCMPGAIPSVSSLLSSLVAKGLVSSPVTESLTPDERSHRIPYQSSGFASISAMLVPSTSANVSDSSLLVKEHLVPESLAPVSAAVIQSTTTKFKDFIGIDFKPEIMCEHHSFVINGLFDDLKHQCRTCGLRFKLLEKLNCHLYWHASKWLEPSNTVRCSRKWYAKLSCWLDGDVGPSYGPVSVTSVEDMVSDGEACEPMVPADENQVICALCGEPFEDFYSCEVGEWMYKDAVLLNLLYRDADDRSMDRILEPAVIVHAKCK